MTTIDNTKTMNYDSAMEIALAGGTVRRLSWGNPYCTVKVNPALLASGFDKYDLTDELIERFLENFEADLIATDWVEVKA
jgi:hypothetical protein